MKFDIRAFALDDNLNVIPKILPRFITGSQEAIQRAVIGLLSVSGTDYLQPDRGIDYATIQKDINNFHALFSINLDRLISFLTSKNDQHEGNAKITDITFDGVKADINQRTITTLLTLYVGEGQKSIIKLPIQL